MKNEKINQIKYQNINIKIQKVHAHKDILNKSLIIRKCSVQTVKNKFTCCQVPVIQQNERHSSPRMRVPTHRLLTK